MIDTLAPSVETTRETEITCSLFDGHVEEAVRQHIERECGIDVPADALVRIDDDLEAVATWTETTSDSNGPDASIRLDRRTVFRHRVVLEGPDTAKALHSWLVRQLDDDAPVTTPDIEMHPGGGYALAATWKLDS